MRILLCVISYSVSQRISLLTQWSTFLQKLIFNQLNKKYPAIYEKGNVHDHVHRGHSWYVSWTN
jgi:hypothetical protein